MGNTYGLGLIFILPFAIWTMISLLIFLFRIMKQKRPFTSFNLYFSISMLLVSFTVVFWDVYHIAKEAEKLCQERAGLHVYKTEKSEGFIGAIGVERWARIGFSYVEYEYTKGKFRYTMENGEPISRKVNNFISKHEVVTENVKMSDRLKYTKYSIINRETTEVLGELFIVGIHGGWADMLFFNITGLSYTPWRCKMNGQHLVYSDLIRATLIPLITKTL